MRTSARIASLAQVSSLPKALANQVLTSLNESVFFYQEIGKQGCQFAITSRRVMDEI